MPQPDLFTRIPAPPVKPTPYFEGPADEPDRAERLGKQLDDVRTLMLDGVWRTLEQIHGATGHPVASVSAQLRHLRKRRFGSFKVSKRHQRNGLWEYRVQRPDAS